MNNDFRTAIGLCRALLVMLLVLLTAACASLVADIDPPRVSVENVRVLPSAGIGPRFEIVLRLANPNKVALDIAGVSYSIDILGRELVGGVTNQVPRVEPYTEETISLETGVNLIEMLHLLGELGRSRNESFDYRFSAKIDFKGFLPTQRVEESGSLSLDKLPGIN
ncbi:MAG: LEA type 2 family protein [Parahaliea sp.]